MKLYKIKKSKIDKNGLYANCDIKKGKKIIHLDIVPEEIGRTLMPTISLWGDALEGIKDLKRVIEGRKIAFSPDKVKKPVDQ